MWIKDDGGPGAGIVHNYVFDIRTCCDLVDGAASGPVLNHARSYMNVISVFYVLCFLGNSFVGFYRGLGMVQVPVFGTILHISIRVILSYVLIRHWGLAAVAFATGAGWAAVVLFQWILYRRVTTEPEA